MRRPYSHAGLLSFAMNESSEGLEWDPSPPEGKRSGWKASLLAPFQGPAKAKGRIEDEVRTQIALRQEPDGDDLKMVSKHTASRKRVAKERPDSELLRVEVHGAETRMAAEGTKRLREDRLV
jgi:hypothetical protein